MLDIYNKGPDDVLDFGVDWSKWLNGDTILTSAWLPVTGIVIDDATQFTATGTTVWLSGGTMNKGYVMTNRITTVAGRTEDHQIKIMCNLPKT